MNNKTYFKYFLFFSIVIVLFFAGACESAVSGKRIKQGKIEYKITYLDNVREKPLIALLPHHMVTVFKNNSTYSVVKGFLFKLVYITDHDNGRNITLFQVMDKKYMYVADTSETPFGYQVDKNVKIIRTEKKKVIAGYNCKHALAVFIDRQDTLEIYYTEELAIKDPNCNNPYKPIKGVLMEFTVKMLDINMKFVAEQVKRKKVDPQLFQPPEGYTVISKKEMEDIVDAYNTPPEE